MRTARLRHANSMRLVGLAALLGASLAQAAALADAPAEPPSTRPAPAQTAPAAAAAAAAATQAPPPEVPRITGGEVEQVTVDVVVLDKKGRPVKGLAQSDFTLLEEGDPKPIASFDIIDRSGAAPPPEPAGRVVTNVGPRAQEAQTGRTFVILFDDLNLSFVNASHAKKAVAAFLDQGTVEGDQVTLIATSGSAWWGTRMKGGREDLLAILKRLDGRRVLETASERITDYEALQIVYNRDILVAGRVQERMQRYGTLRSEGDQDAQAQAENLRTIFQRGIIDPYVEHLAVQTYSKAKARMETSLTAVERATRALTEGRSRKALLLFSEGFIDDPTQGGPRRVVEAARRANAALYFVDAGGLKGLDPMYSAEFGPALDARDTMTAIADLSREGEGAVVLAERTGGFSIRGTNDFAGGAARIGRESQSYYLLGYNPGDIPRDGRFRRIEVKVRGDYTVRARRGYFAPTATGETPRSNEPKGTDAVLQRALDAPGFADQIPLRMATYVLDSTGLGRTRVIVAVDADISHVDFRDASGRPEATLETLTVVAHRDSGEALRTDQTVQIQRKPGVTGNGGPMWYSFLREFEVPSGAHQVKLVVRDAASNRVGTLAANFAVPPTDEFRVSTPVLTDTLSDAGGGPVPVLLTRRAFPGAANLYCRFDVFGARKGADGLPKVRAGYTLRRTDGAVAGRATPTLIEPTSLGALARMVQIPLRSLAPGEYEIALTVTDELGGQTRELVEPFSITAAAAATASR